MNKELRRRNGKRKEQREAREKRTRVGKESENLFMTEAATKMFAIASLSLWIRDPFSHSPVVARLVGSKGQNHHFPAPQQHDCNGMWVGASPSLILTDQSALIVNYCSYSFRLGQRELPLARQRS